MEHSSVMGVSVFIETPTHDSSKEYPYKSGSEKTCFMMYGQQRPWLGSATKQSDLSHCCLSVGSVNISFSMEETLMVTT